MKNKEGQSTQKHWLCSPAFRWLVVLCRIVLAATFLFSGFVKANDPFGMTYKLEDYMAAFGLGHLLPETFLLGCAVLLALFEFMLGVNLLFGISRKATARVTAAFMAAMTLLTLYIAIANPVSDCGCFGDAIILSNTATFMKNIVLMACAVVIQSRYSPRKGEAELQDDNKAQIGGLRGLLPPASLIGIVAYAIYCIVSLPVIDFRPYKVGVDLRENIEAVQSQKMYDVKIVYERNGETLELSADDDDPDSTWSYVETKRIELDAKGMATVDFYAEDGDGESIVDDIIYDEGYVLLLVIPDLRHADEGCIDKVNEAFDKARDMGVAFYCLTGSTDEASQAYWREHTGAEYAFYTADERMLKTVVRGNPGLVLMKDGVIQKKWSNYNLPEDITELLN